MMSSRPDEEATKSSHNSSSRPGFREPDVVVVVGGEEFHESSHFLRYHSDYFEAAFQSGMKEAQQMRFEFPDKRPEEWRMIKSLLQPFGEKKIDTNNLNVSVAWFDELCIPAGIHECDKYLSTRLQTYQADVSSRYSLSNAGREFFSKVLIRAVLGYWRLCSQSNLVLSKPICYEVVRQLLEDYPAFVKRDRWPIICSLLSGNEECRRELWESFAQNLPPGVVDLQEPQALLSNALLPSLIFAEIHRKK